MTCWRLEPLAGKLARVVLRGALGWRHPELTRLPVLKVRQRNGLIAALDGDLRQRQLVILEGRLAASQHNVFTIPNAKEAEFVSQIYAVSHFQQNIELQKLLKGGRNADPFVIAKAAVEGKTVVTMELFKPNGVKIPNICQYFKIRCLTLEQFMDQQSWTF